MFIASTESLSHIRSTASDVVSPSPKGRGVLTPSKSVNG